MFKVNIQTITTFHFNFEDNHINALLIKFSHHLETNQQIYSANELAGIYVARTFDVKSFLAGAPNLYLLKTLENRRFSSVFRGFKMEKLARNGLMSESSVFIVDFWLLTYVYQHRYRQ